MLKKRQQRDVGDLDHATRATLRPSLPAGYLVPVGYQRDDTRELLMLAGNVAVCLRSPTPDTYDSTTSGDHLHQPKRPSPPRSSPGTSSPPLVLARPSDGCCGRPCLPRPVLQPLDRTATTWQGYLTFGIFAPMPLLGMPATHRPAGQLNLQQPVLDPHRDDRQAAGADRSRVPHTVTSPGPPAPTPIPRQELRRDPHPLGQTLRHVRPELRRVSTASPRTSGPYNPVKVGYHGTVDIVNASAARASRTS